MLYLYDLDWHVDSIDYNFTIDCLKSVNLLCCRNEAHADKIEELCGRRPVIVSNNLKELVDDLRNTK